QLRATTFEADGPQPHALTDPLTLASGSADNLSPVQTRPERCVRMASARPIKLPPRRTGLAAVARRQNLPTLGLAAVALALAVLIGHDVFFPGNPNLVAALQTFTVGTGTVTNSVSSSGTLVPAQQLNLGFKTAGTLTEVDVRSGDHVSAGQVLARIDTTPLQIALQTAQAQLA